MKLSDWARKNGLDYKTAYRLFRSGRFPLPTEQLATGTILVTIPEKVNKNDNAGLYARVSSIDQKDDLERQLERIRSFAYAKGFKVVEEVKEIGSGLNGKRKKLMKLLSNDNIGIIIVEHRDRLTRFGSEYINSVMEASNRKLYIMNESECDDDLVQDMIDVLTSFCARLYGRRGARNRAKRALELVKNNGDNKGI